MSYSVRSNFLVLIFEVLLKSFLLAIACLVAVSLFTSMFSFRLIIPLPHMDCIISAGIDHGGNAFHYHGFSEGLKSFVMNLKNLGLVLRYTFGF